MSLVARARARLHARFRELLDEHSAPGRLAAAVVVGTIVGVTPFFGLHIFFCLALAWLLRLNKVTMYAAANISIPPAVPFLGYASVQVGAWLLRGRFRPLALADLPRASFRTLLSDFGDLFIDWVVGGVVVGAAIGVVLAAAVYRIARARARRRADPILAAIVEASRRYRAAPRPMRMYAFFKYRLDPCYRALAARIPEGTLTVDLGTGLGMLPMVLALLPGGRRATGVDWDAAKLGAGRAAALGLDAVELVEGDARRFAIPPCDAITLVDVLHYYDPATQRALIDRCAAALRPGGVILIREGDSARDRGARFTRVVESIAVRIGWNRGEGATRFRAAEELRSELERAGLEVEISPVSGRLHPGNVLLAARRRIPEPAAPSPTVP